CARIRYNYSSYYFDYW
nr:immunoglobulin heavy chain junction region [Macaca mulatta]